MKLGMVGLGRMGSNMSERLRKAGHEVIGYSRSHGDVGSLMELVEALDERPRVCWLMLPAGEPTEQTISTLADLLSDGDVIVDGGNSNYNDSMRRKESLEGRGIGFVDAGVSGGIWGLKNGYCLMVGGDGPVIDKVRPAFDALAPEAGFARVGPSGAGHFTKMVHNGIEYGMMQSLGEGYELLGASELGIDVKGAMSVWMNGSVVRSWLLELLVSALDEDPQLKQVRGYAEDSGEGRWALQEAVRLAVPTPAIAASLFARFVSRQQDSPALKVVAALRKMFGGHSVKT